MSASSGIIAKGEKGKSKFQSLDINNLYKSTESEPTQQKGTLLRTKNGMQSLGKVPTARRPPANLPSLKAESSGNEPAVSLVPAGAAGWGSKPGEGPPPQQQQQQQQPSVPPVSSGNPAPPPAPVAVVTPVVMVPPPHEQAMHNLMPGPDKSWSAIMAREQVPNFLAHQSPQFQHEFPKLASEGGPGAPGKPGDAQYGPGPSLRPQTEGSWTAGGGRPQPGVPPGPLPQSLGPGLHGSAGPEPGGVRTNLGPHPGVGAPMGPAGPAAIPINFPHGGGYRPLQHSFMMPPRPGTFTPPMGGMRPRYPGPGGPGGPGYPPDSRFPPGRAPEGDEPVTRPIIRDEELNKMDEIARDPGWAANEDIDYNQQLAFSDNEDATEGDSNRKDPRKDRSEKSRGKEDEKDKGELDRRSEERGMDKRGGEWDRGGRHRGYQGGPDDDRRKPRDTEDDRRKMRDAEDERRKLRDAEEERRKLREMEEERRKLREMEEERRKLREIEEERRKLRETEESRRKVREEVAVAVQVARQRKESEAKRFDESKRGDRKDGRDWDERGMKRDLPDVKRDDHREGDQKRDGDHGKYETKREPDASKYEREPKRDDHGKYDREAKHDDGKYDREPKRDDHGKYDREANRDTDHGKYDREAKRDSDHGKYDRETKREADHVKYDRETKRDDHGKYEGNKRENDHGKYERDYRGRMDDRRDFRQGPRAPQYKQLPPRLQAQADRMNSQRSTGSPQPSAPPPPPANNFDPHWGHGRRYGPDSGEESRDRHTPDTYSDRYKAGHGRDTRDRFPDRHPFPDADHRRHFDRKDRESDSERIPEDGYKKPREVEPRKEERKEPSEEQDVWRAPVRDDREEERRPQRPDSRDSRTSRDSRNSREDRHDSDHKSRGFPAQVKEDKHREEIETKGASRHAPTPPRERPDVAEPDKKPARSDSVLTPPTAPTSALSDDLKDEKEDKAGAQEESRQKGKSARGGRWGSGPNTTTSSSSTYVRNGSRNEQRRRRVSGGNWSRPENESGSSGEGGSELEKGEKEERNRETRRSGDGTGRDGFAPSGQPSRRGRGAARVRGGATAAPRRMDGYGPPPVKASFPQTEQPAAVEEEEDRTKQKQAALNAGIAGGAARVAASQRPVAPRMQRTQSNRDPTRPKTSRGPRRSGGKGGVDGDEAWETMSNSDGEERKSEGRVRRGGGPSSRGAPPRSAAHRPQPAGAGTGTSNNRSVPPSTEGKEEKAADIGKPKPVEGDADSSQSTNLQDGRPKKMGKDGYKGVKPESGPRSSTGGPGKDRLERQERPDRRGKPANQPIPPVNPNPTGPQPLMSQVVNPPPTMKNFSSGGGSTWRQVTALPPRLQKQQDQQRQHANHASHANDSHDLSKMAPSMFPAKGEGLQTRENAWEKPLGPPSRSPAEQGPSETSSQRSSPGGKLPSVRGDPLLDDSAPPVNTIIFENTNLKSAPGGFSAGLKQPHRVTKGNEWKPGEELFGKAELGPEPLPDHSMKPPLYRAEQGIEIDLLNAELAEMTEENAADLKHRLAGTKTLWDQNEDEQSGSAVFPAAFCQDSGMDGSGFGKTVEGVMVGMDGSGFGKSVEGVVVPDDCIMHPGEVVYMSKHDPTTSSNVCKVKPQQQAVLSTGHSPLSPPPFSSTQQGQFNYPQAGLGGSPAQFGGMPAIPSPPAGLPYSSQQLQPSGGLFTPFQLERSQCSQFSTQFSTPYGLSAGLGGTSTFNQPPLYLPHAAPPSDLFSSMSQYRVQQHPSAHTNPNTVLLTSSANSLMSASVKPSSQSIGVIGSKGPTYQQNNQMFIPFDAMQLGVNQSYLSGSGMVQRSAPVQSAAPNFYANSPGPQAGFYNTPNSGLGQPMASLQQPYGRQGFVNQSTTHNLQNYSSQVHLEMGYRNPGAVGPASYLKSGVGNNTVSQQDVLASVFNSAPPKTRPPKQVSQPPPQHSPTQQTANKFASYPSAAQLAVQQQQQQQHQSANQQRVPQANMGLQGVQGVRSAPRYPTPIQRPMAYRGRPGPPQQRSGGKPYFEAQDGKLEEPSDLSKPEEASQLNCESKLTEPAQPGKVETVEQDAPPVKE